MTQKRARERPQALAVKLSDSAAAAAWRVFAAAIAVTIEHSAAGFDNVGYGAALDQNLPAAAVVFDQITGKDSGFRLGAKTGIACCHGLHVKPQ
jgi:hypothetical protein